MQSEIKKVKFKPGLPLEIEVIPIAQTVTTHQQIITNPHRAEFYHIFWVQKGTAHYQIDFETVTVKPNSFLFVSKDKVQSLDNRSKHDGRLLLFTDYFFAKHEADSKYLHSSILFNDLVDIPIINVTYWWQAKDIWAAIILPFMICLEWKMKRLQNIGIR